MIDDCSVVIVDVRYSVVVILRLFITGDRLTVIPTVVIGITVTVVDQAC